MNSFNCLSIYWDMASKKVGITNYFLNSFLPMILIKLHILNYKETRNLSFCTRSFLGRSKEHIRSNYGSFTDHLRSIYGSSTEYLRSIYGVSTEYPRNNHYLAEGKCNLFYYMCSFLWQSHADTSISNSLTGLGIA
jgi:hypothetical protein